MRVTSAVIVTGTVKVKVTGTVTVMEKVEGKIVASVLKG